MKTLTLLSLFTIISYTCFPQVNLSAQMQTPSIIDVGDSITEINCEYSLAFNDNILVPSCSRNYSGKNLFFNFVMPESGQVKLEVLLKSVVDHGVALYYVSGEQWNELDCSQVISEKSYIEYCDTALAGQMITGRIWINSGADNGILKLKFDNTEEENGAKIPVIGVLSATPEELVNNVLISGCVQALNIEFTGHPESIGFFTNGTPGLDFNSGIILSTGKAIKVAGPNSSPATCTNLQQPGDSLLTSIINRATYDAAILEFDFIPSNNTISFQYAFGSEEYEEYVGGVFNDIFTFHISGGPENYQNVNIAKIPGTNTPVSINNVNQNQNTSWYTNNNNGAHLQFDGMTTTMTAVTAVTPCETYHIRLAIADAADPIFDSGVFLKAGSFNSGTIPLVKNITDWVMVNNTYEGCENNLMFARSDNNNIDTPLDFNIEIGGTAVMGVDYTAIPLSLQIPAGQESLAVPYSALIDEIVEGSETIVVKIFTGCQCGIEFIEETIYINDNISVSGSISNNSPQCAGDSVLINLNIVQLPELYEIIWSTGNVGGTEINAVLTESQFVTAEVRYPCGSELFSTWVEIMPLPVANVETNAPICDGEDLTFFAENGISYLWKGPEAYVSEINNPVIVAANPSQSGFYGVTVTGSNGCQYKEMLDISIHEWPNPILPESQVLCERDNLVINPGAFYQYQWLGPSNWTSDQNTLTINNIITQNSGIYYLTVSDEIGCTGTASTQIHVNVSPVAFVEFNYPVCRNEDLILSGTGDGNVWWTGPNALYSEAGTITIEDVDQQDSGIYGFYVVNEFNCSDSVISEIEITIPDASITATGNYCSATNEVILSSEYTGGIWSGTGITNPQTGAFSPALAGSGAHIISYYIGYPGCDDTQDLNVTVDEAPQISLSVPSEICNNQTPITLIAEPIGGIWTGVGVSLSEPITFNPTLAGIGTQTLFYTISSGACNISDSINIEVFEGIDAQILPELHHCENELAFYLHSVSSGGFWTGTGITNIYTGRFDPQLAGPGTHRIYHSINNQHCEDIDSIDIIIDEYFDANIGEDLSFCINQSNQILEADISGGLWSGFGITDIYGTFSPQTAGVGNGIVTYSFTNGECFDADTINVTVSDFISSDFSLPAQICEFENPVQLISQNLGGVWSGNGITDSINGVFNPAIAGEGIQDIVYSISNGACESNSSKQIEVIDAPDPSFDGSFIYCVNDMASQLQSITPGGLWSGNGITDPVLGIFNPSIAGTGPSLVTYAVSNSNCISERHQYLWVFDGTENIIFNTPESVCSNLEDYVLHAEPEGGIWTGDGVSNDSIFSPFIAGSGIHELTYTLGTGTCESTSIFSINVTDVPIISMVSQDMVCANEILFQLLADAEGGNWWGNAVVDGNFVPSLAILGENAVYYNFDNGVCENTYQYIVFVNPVTPAFISGLETSYCNDFGTVAVEFFPVGGINAGIELTSTHSFSTLNLLPGQYDITYTFTNEYGCESIATTQTEILEVPEVLVSGVENDYCINSNDISFHAIPWGGVVEGLEISGNTISPSSTGIGEHFLSYSYTAPNGCTDEYFQSVNIHGLPEISFEILNYPSCFSTNDAVVRAIVTSTNNYEIIWDNLAENNTEIFENISQGWHYIKVISEFGCEITDSIFITAPEELEVLISGTENLPCFNSNNGVINAVVNGGTPNYNYIWNTEDSATSSNLSGLGPGNYQVTVTDINGCSISAEHSILQAAEISYSIEKSEEMTCFGDNTGFISVEIDLPDVSILWADGDTEFSRSNLNAGVYYFTITNSSDCQLVDSVTLTEPAEIFVEGVINPVNCGQNFGGIFTGTTGGVAPYQYLWSTGGESSVLLDVPVGEYILTVTDSRGCLNSFEFIVNAIDSIDAEIQILQNVDCYGNNSGILYAVSDDGIAPLSYYWSNNTSGSTITDVFAGDYLVTLTDQQGCKGYSQISLTNPPQLIVNSIITNVKCNGDSGGNIELLSTGGTGNLSYVWAHGFTGNIATDLTAGSYSFSVTDANNCMISQIIDITEPESELGCFIIKQESKCFGESNGYINPQAKGGAEPYNYMWQNEEYVTNEQNILGLFAGDYYLTITDANNCSMSTKVQLPQPEKIDVRAIGYPVSCNGNNDGFFEISAVGGTGSYQYLFNKELYQSGSFGQNFPGVYSVRVIDENNCVSDTVNVIVDDSDDDCIIIPNAYTPNGDGVNDKWEIVNIDKFPRARIQVFNRWGQIVFESVSNEEIWEGTTNVGELPAGTYIYIVEPNNGSASYNGTVSLVR